jgi:hypothetical protein
VIVHFLRVLPPAVVEIAEAEVFRSDEAERTGDWSVLPHASSITERAFMYAFASGVSLRPRSNLSVVFTIVFTWSTSSGSRSSFLNCSGSCRLYLMWSKLFCICRSVNSDTSVSRPTIVTFAWSSLLLRWSRRIRSGEALRYQLLSITNVPFFRFRCLVRSYRVSRLSSGILWTVLDSRNRNS